MVGAAKTAPPLKIIIPFMNYKKSLLAFFALSLLFSCAKIDDDAKKTARTRAAQERINSSKSNADNITKELD